jgi:hypothetical protein
MRHENCRLSLENGHFLAGNVPHLRLEHSLTLRKLEVETVACT